MRLVSAMLLPCLLGLGLGLAGVPGGSRADDQAATTAIKLESLKWSQFKERLAASKGGKVHTRRCLGHDLRPLQGELPAPG